MKRFFAALFVFMIIMNLFATGYASTLGSSRISGYSLEIAEDTFFTTNVFYSDQSGVGKQSEYYITYKPNAAIVPVVTNGEYLFGSETISSEVERLEKKDVNIVGGVNADFFSFKTGVPMSNLVMDNEIISKDEEWQEGFGITNDGTTFMAKMRVTSQLTREDGTKSVIHNINKYRQPYTVYMMTDKFSDTTENETAGYDVILTPTAGEMQVGKSIEAVVEAVEENSGAIKIPKGKIILTVDKNAPYECVETVSSLKEGEKVRIDFEVEGDERWYNARLGIGSIGGRLLTGGVINPDLEKGAAPRTAIGIKEDGSIILYTIDGRQQGHSYGVQLKTLAERMKELGCVDALNLDGGGSTSIVALLPGDKTATLKNSPSEGKERKVSTFFFLENTLSPTGQTGNVFIYPLECYMLYGAEKKFDVKITDTAFYPMDLSSKPVFSIGTQGLNSTITSDGVLTAKDDGAVRIRAEINGIVGEMDVYAMKTPTDIKIKNENGDYISEITLDAGEGIKLNAEAYGGYNVLVSQNDNFSWKVEGNIGTISADGYFASYEKTKGEGRIVVSAGDKSISVPVKVNYIPDETEPGKEAEPDEEEPNAENPFSDTKGHWAEKVITYMYENGIISGEKTKEGLIFRPQKEMTRAEFSVMMCNYLKINISEYEDVSLPFGDSEKIPKWAKGSIKALYKKGIVAGKTMPDGSVSSAYADNLTRAEAATIIARTLEKGATQKEISARDKEDIPKWAREGMEKLFSMGAMTGYKDGTIKPLANLTKAEAAKLIYSIM